MRDELWHGMTEDLKDTPVPLDSPQLPLLIEHPVGLAVVTQRPTDGYINATELCQRAEKLFGNYNQNAQTRAFLEELSTAIGIPIAGSEGLVQIRMGGSDPSGQGTWVHPRVAIHLAQWLSPAFAVQVTKWVMDWVEGRAQAYMPVHVQRFLLNRAKIPHTHFSMLNEIYLHLFAPLEDVGLIPPDSMMPDISTGRMFSEFLRSQGIEPNRFPNYTHEFADQSRRAVQARLYPIEHLPAFRQYFYEEWLPGRAPGYFKERLPRALPYLPRIIGIANTQRLP